MKLALLFFVAALLVSPAAGVKVLLRGSTKPPGTIKQVVEILQSLLDESKKEGDTERELYAKFKCYCDDTAKAKRQSIEVLTEQIGLLESQVAGIQASSGALSLSVAQLQKSMDSNVEARKTAEDLRKKQNEVFLAEEADLKSAIDQMKQALDILSTIGADQTPQASAAHTKFMAGYKPGGASLVKLQSSVSQALVAASAFLSPDMREKVVEFLQTRAPFNDAYVANSGGVAGILKSMRDTFESNLASAQKNEQAAVKAYDAFIATKTAEWDTLKGAFDAKQATLGTNDGDLATKKTQLAEAKQQKVDDEAFLAKLKTTCSSKVADYEKRVALRLEEQAGFSKAIAILNSDHAFGIFDKVTATKTGATSLLQLGVAESYSVRSAARRYLQGQFPRTKSARIARVAALLAIGNPFDKVFDAIDKMKAVITEEATQDLEQKTWCEKERSLMDGNLEATKGQITELNNAISSLDQTINDPETGLVKMIADDETALEENAKAQKAETDARRDENKDYQKNVANCVEAAAILKKAIKALEAYYKKKDDELRVALGFVQKREDPSPPETWSGDYVGQSKGGNNVITMLEFILSETGKEEVAAHETERAAQAEYEESMKTLKQQQKDTAEALANKKRELADSRLSLEERASGLSKTEQEKVSVERYLEKIKPGCDFIMENYATREANRATETAALDKAVELLKRTPSYVSAKSSAEELLQGECAKVCKVDATKVECKACLAKVSVPGYCAGHPGTEGC